MKSTTSLRRQRFVRNSPREGRQVDHESYGLLYRGHPSLVAGESQTSKGDSRGEMWKPRRGVRDRQIRSTCRSLAHLGQSAANLRSRRATRWDVEGVARILGQSRLLSTRKAL